VEVRGVVSSGQRYNAKDRAVSIYKSGNFLAKQLVALFKNRILENTRFFFALAALHGILAYIALRFQAPPETARNSVSYAIIVVVLGWSLSWYQQKPSRKRKIAAYAIAILPCLVFLLDVWGFTKPQ